MIDDRRKALMLIKDLCVVANNDKDLEDAEIEYILDIAEVMGIDPLRVKEINEAVNEYIELSKKTSIRLQNYNFFCIFPKNVLLLQGIC